MTAPNLGLLAPSWSPATWLAAGVLLLVLAVVTVISVTRARRLDRLHRRTDAARAGLADALDRRATAASAVADALAHGPPRSGDRAAFARRAEVAALRTAAHAAQAACRDAMRTSGVGLEPCEVAENALTRRLAALDRRALPVTLAAELVEAEQLVLLARRVHNDAVRDTLDLRSRRLVRWLRLAGTAPAPAYFEIADPQRRDAPPADRADVPSPVTGTGVAG
jgi:hypothetical protein